MKRLFLSVVTTVILFTVGCSSNPKFSFNTDTRRITILTEPEGAAVFQVNICDQPSTSLGLSPVNDRSVMVVSQVTRAKNMSYYQYQKLMEQVDNVVVRIKKDGYETYEGTLRTDPKETVTHAIKLHPKEVKSK